MLFFSLGKTGYAFLFFFIICFVSLFQSINPGDGLYEVSKSFLHILLFLLSVYILRKSSDGISVLVKAINIFVLILSVIAMVQILIRMYEVSHHLIPAFSERSITSTFANKNFYGETILLCMPFSIFAFLFFKTSWKFIGIAAFCSELITIFLTYSLAVWLGFAIGLIAMTVLIFFNQNPLTWSVLSKSKKTATAMLFILSMLLLFMAFQYVPGISIRFNQMKQKASLLSYYLTNRDRAFEENKINGNSFYERLLLIRNSLKIIKANPLMGCGTGNWKIFSPKYGVVGTGYLNMGIVRFEHPHNDYLLIWSENGIPGILCWLGIFLFGFRSIRSVLKRNTDTQLSYLMYFLVFGIIAFMVISLFSYPKERFYSMLLLVLLLAIPASLEPVMDREKPSWRPWILVCVFILTMFAFYIHTKRLQGELYMKKALDYQHKKDLNAMGNQVKKAHSFFYPLDITGTPLNWYIGFAGFHMGDEEKAFRYFREALIQNPYHLQVLNDLGTLYDKKGMYDNAIELYVRALAISPNNYKTILNMASVCYNAGKNKEAFDWIRKYPGSKSNIPYQTALKAILLKEANHYVQEKKDSVLANYLSFQLRGNENFLVQLFDSSGKQGLMLERVSAAVSKIK